MQYGYVNYFLTVKPWKLDNITPAWLDLTVRKERKGTRPFLVKSEHRPFLTSFVQEIKPRRLYKSYEQMMIMPKFQVRLLR